MGVTLCGSVTLLVFINLQSQRCPHKDAPRHPPTARPAPPLEGPYTVWLCTACPPASQTLAVPSPRPCRVASQPLTQTRVTRGEKGGDTGGQGSLEHRPCWRTRQHWTGLAFWLMVGTRHHRECQGESYSHPSESPRMGLISKEKESVWGWNGRSKNPSPANERQTLKA